MKQNFDYLGTDLLVAPFAAAHDAQVLDLSLRVGSLSGNISPDAPPLSGQDALDSKGSDSRDFSTVSGRENLAHALLLRMLTPRGSLAELGHAAYGSRLHELIGRNKDSSLRDLCRAFVLEVIAQEPRVENQAVSVTFDPLAETAQNFVFSVAVKPVNNDDVVNLQLEVAV